jgi:ribonuclease-3
MFDFLRRESQEDRELRQRLEVILGFRPKSMALYRLALTHSSAGLEVKDGVPLSNERLEYLGDAVLGAVAAKYLFKRFPFESEGFLTETRSKIVSRKNLGSLATKLGLREMVNKEGSLDKATSSLGGDALEALVGAAFLDRGFELTERFVATHLIDSHIDLDQLLRDDANFKSTLIEHCQREKLDFSFEVANQRHRKGDTHFEIAVVVDGKNLGKGMGRTKKEAEQDASRQACEKLGIATHER